MSQKSDRNLRKETRERWEFFLENDPEIRRKTDNIPKTLPLLPIQIDRSNFHSIFNQSFRLIMNSQNASSADLILNSKNRFSKMILNRVDKNNYYIESLPVPAEKIPDLKFEGEEDLLGTFEILEDWLIKEYNFDVGNLRVMSEDFIANIYDIYRQFLEENGEGNILLLIGKYLDEVLSARESMKLIYHPPSPLIESLMELQEIWGDFSFYSLFERFQKTLPEKCFTISLISNEGIASYYINNESKYMIVQYVRLPETIVTEQDEIKKKKEVLQWLAKNFKSKYNYLIQIKPIVSWLHEYTRSPKPLSSKRRRFLSESMLKIYKSINQDWDFFPKSLMHLGGMRYFLYIFGLKYYTEKISYWSIPTLFKLFSQMEVGLNSNWIVLISDDLKNLNENHINRALLVKSENGNIDHIENITQQIKPMVLKDLGIKGSEKFKLEKVPQERLDSLRIDLLEKLEIDCNLIWFDTKIFEEFLSTFTFNLHTWGIGPKKVAKCFKILQNSNFIRLSPEGGFYRYFKQMSGHQILKTFSPLLTDLHEF